jgi:hypothetical protein
VPGAGCWDSWRLWCKDAAEHQAWADRFAAALRDGGARAYVNFLGDEGQARIHQAYPGPTWERLVAIKAR